MKLLRTVGVFAFAFGLSFPASSLGAQGADTAAIVRALVARLDSAEVGKPTAGLLSAFVTSAGPRHRHTGGFVDVPAVTMRSLVRVQPPSDSGGGSVREWSNAVRRFARLYSIGEITIGVDVASVDVYIREPFTSDGVRMFGVSQVKHRLKRNGNQWRAVQSEPILSTTFVDGN